MPATFEELYREYHPYVLTLVRKFGIDPVNVEDVTSQLMIKLLEKDLVSQFDGKLVSTYTGKPVEFKSYLYNFIAVYVQHHRHRQQVIKRRDCYYIGSSDTPDGVVEDEASYSWLAARGIYHEDTYEDLTLHELLSQIRTLLEREPQKASEKVRLPEFFEKALRQVEETGKLNQTELAAHFGVSLTTIWKRTQRLREIVRPLVATA